MSRWRPAILRDFDTGSTQLELDGRWGEEAERELSTLLGDGTVDAPLALVLKLDRVAVADATPLATFLRRWVSHRAEPPCLILSVNPGTPTGRLVHAVLAGRTAICDSIVGAIGAAREMAVSRRRMHAHLPPDPLSAGTARRLIEAACDAWGLADLVDNARVVATELVTNAVEHGRTELDIGISATGRLLRISVRDRSTQQPRRQPVNPPGDIPQRGRGLIILDALAVEWGFLVYGDGKTVWATVGQEQPA